MFLSVVSMQLSTKERDIYKAKTQKINLHCKQYFKETSYYSRLTDRRYFVFKKLYILLFCYS
jgi:hypothetical protein